MTGSNIMAQPAEFDGFDVPDKDPDFKYRWCNSDTRAMMRHKHQGYEVVMDEAKTPIVQKVENAQSPNPGQVTRTRGNDLVLMRIRKDVFEKNIESRRAAIRAQHEGAIDNAISQADENAVRKARERNIRGVKRLVFRTTDGPGFVE